MSSEMTLFLREKISSNDFTKMLNHYATTIDCDMETKTTLHCFKDGGKLSIDLANHGIDEIAEHEDRWNQIIHILNGEPQSAIDLWMNRPNGYLIAQDFILFIAQIWNVCILDNRGAVHSIEALSRLTISGSIF